MSVTSTHSSYELGCLSRTDATTIIITIILLLLIIILLLGGGRLFLFVVYDNRSFLTNAHKTKCGFFSSWDKMVPSTSCS